VINY